jgi:hypothetical protein
MRARGDDVDPVMNASPIPEPRLRMVENHTPFMMFQCDKMGVGRKFFDTVVVKGTFALAQGKLELAEDQDEIALVDETWDPANAERSSLRRAGDLVLTKPSTDIIVTGTARIPGEARREWDVAVEVRRRGERELSYQAQVLGPRRFRHTAEKGWGVTEPEPAVEVPIRYELAYGGSYPIPEGERGEDGAESLRPKPGWVVYPQNPSGTGFFDERAMDLSVEYNAPQWQTREHPVAGSNREVPLTGLGPVARPWDSRLKYAGTYDDDWVRTTRAEVAQGLPSDYAKDFDPRFFQCAHPQLITPRYLEGEEEIILTGLLPVEAPFSLLLPHVRIRALMLDGKGERPQQWLNLDTVHIDLDASTVSLCWRLTLDQARDIQFAILALMEAA